MQFEVSEDALLWDHKDHRYKIPVKVLAPNLGLDGAARSYWIQDESGRQRLVHVSWLVKVPAEPAPTPAANPAPTSA